MGALLSYSIIASIILFFCYLPYCWFMANRKEYAFNRIVIYVMYGMSLFAPFFVLNESSDIGNTINVVSLGLPNSHMMNPSVNILAVKGYALLRILIVVYTIGMTYVTLMYLAGVVKILSIIKKSHCKITNDTKIAVCKDCTISPFSWGNIIVMSKLLYESEEKMMVLAHESAHVKLRHWIDLIFAQIIICLQWYNPIAWRVRTQLKEIHEFQADEYVLTRGVSRRQYQLFLISATFSSKFNLPTNLLKVGNTRKRIEMMSIERRPADKRIWAVSIIVFLIVGILACNLAPVKNIIWQFHNIVFYSHESGVSKYPESPKESFVPDTKQSLVEASPKSDFDMGEFVEAEYIDGDMALMKILMNQIKYPKEAEKNRIQGNVIVSFELSKEGNVVSLGIKTPIDRYLDEEALRVCREISRFKPATLNGIPVASTYELPIRFRLAHM